LVGEHAYQADPIAAWRGTHRRPNGRDLGWRYLAASRRKDETEEVGPGFERHQRVLDCA
jgi:hypothetical protein